MLSSNKIGDLRTASTNFVDIVMAEPDTPIENVRTSMSMIEYNGWVVVSDELLNRLNTQGEQLATPNDEFYNDPDDFTDINPAEQSGARASRRL